MSIAGDTLPRTHGAPHRRGDATAALTPGSRVPAEWVGRARHLRTRVADAHARWYAAAADLTAPLRPRGDFSPTFVRQSLSLLSARWKALPEWGRVGIVARDDRATVQILETRIAPFVVTMPNWTEAEPSLAIILYCVTMRVPATFTEATRLVAGIGLHALARRFERGADRSDISVLRDLTVFGRAWSSAAIAGGDFEIAALGGGRWRGAVMGLGGRPALAVRTFVT